jgi:hypothetical protein
VVYLAVVDRDRALAVFADPAVAMEDDRFFFFGVSASVVDGIDASLDDEFLVEFFPPLQVIGSV